MDWPQIAPLLAAFTVPLALSWIFTALHIRAAEIFGLIDQPSERKFHQKPTPTGAGIASFAAVTCSAGFLASVCGFTWTAWNVHFLVAGLVVAFGLLDDHRTLSWQLRVVVYSLAALATFQAPWEYRVPAAIWIVVLINAFNFLDNMDGLCAGVAWILAACLFTAKAW
ncbi:MAG TPA: hypothetical protein VKE94_07960, partial [Gemmataceae bacterium]|nr:hypothetical protein [Gemmataceae bacterium]